MDRITTLDLRAHLGELLDRVRLRFETFVIERKGREIAAIVPAERARRLEDFARRRSVELEAVQAAFVREKGFDTDEVEKAIAKAAREVKAARKARRR
jgi:prevent-host-death family protein